MGIGLAPDGPEFELYILLDRIPDLPVNFLVAADARPERAPARNWVRSSAWMSAFTPDDDVWPGRFSIMSRAHESAHAPARVSCDLRPAEFEIPDSALRRRERNRQLLAV
jgi:hypothetical protein